MQTSPSFTETFFYANVLGNAGGVFSTAIDQLPQVAAYAALYRQYRINSVRVMMLPDMSGDGVDINTLYQQNAVGGSAAGLGRIAYAINDTPALGPPAGENDVLQDNGSRVVPLKSKWTVSYKPVVSAFTGDAAGNAGVAMRPRSRPFLSFAPEGIPNPLHYGVSYWISHFAAGPAPAVQTWRVYMKVNFSLRDPK